MKFARSLQFNCNPDWSEHYISYEHFKRLIYQIEKAELDERKAACFQTGSTVDLVIPESLTESKQTVQVDYSRRLHVQFADEIKDDIKKVLAFYESMKRECFAQVSRLQEVINGIIGLEREGGSRRTARARQASWPHGMATPWSLLPHSFETPTEMFEKEVTFSKLAKELYVTIHDLHDFLQLNYTGFSKILKKHDKVTHLRLRDLLMRTLEMSLPLQELPMFDKITSEIEESYARIICSGRKEEAVSILRHLLRERLVYERSTVWQDMVKMERKAANVAVIEPVSPIISSSIGSVPKRKLVGLVLGLTVFVVLLSVRIMKEKTQQNCLAMLALVSILWCTETFPLYVTSMLIPLLVVVLRTLRNPTTGARLDSSQASIEIFHVMFSQVIMLLLGGFSIAAALSKYGIAKTLATKMLSSSRKTSVILLKIIGISAFASMWVTNVAAPVICYSVIQPIMRHLGADSAFAKSMVIGVAIGANIGGMASPISSPQNVIAIERMVDSGAGVTWAQWLLVSIPVCTVSIVLCWGVLRIVYKDEESLPEVCNLRYSGDPISWRQIYVVSVALITIGLWCLGSWVKVFMGEMGAVAIIPLVAYFGSGVLNKDDFNGFLWNVVMLAMGGLALGEAVKSSGLLAHIGHLLERVFGGYSLFFTVFVFALVILAVTTFISHTVGALILLPLMQSIGEEMSEPHPRLLIMAAALICSAGMGLPISGFPNINAVAQEDGTGKPYLVMKDFMMVGIPASMIVVLVVTTIGTGIMCQLGF